MINKTLAMALCVKHELERSSLDESYNPSPNNIRKRMETEFNYDITTLEAFQCLHVVAEFMEISK